MVEAGKTSRQASGSEAKMQHLRLHCGACVQPRLTHCVRFKRRSTRETPHLHSSAAGQGQEGVDLVLSSGYMAFAKHAGFLKAFEEADLDVKGVMGTSAGALAGSLYCAGYTPEEIAYHLCRTRPIQLLKPNLFFWNGFLLLDGVVHRLRELLPPTFESLDKPFSVGVVNVKGEHQLISSGPLPEAVAASAAIPIMFAPVRIPGNDLSPFLDGGVRDRIGLQIWREHQRNGTDSQRVPPAVVHLIARSTLFSGADDLQKTGEKRVFMLRSKRSERSLLGLGDYNQEMLETYERLAPTMETVQQRMRERVTA